MNNSEKQRVLELQELAQVTGGRFEVQDWSTSSEGCGGVDDDEWSTWSNDCRNNKKVLK